MAAVIRLVQKSNKETVELLEWLLQEARANRCNDLFIWFRDQNGEESSARTGLYKMDTAKALMAAMRASKHLTLIGG